MSNLAANLLIVLMFGVGPLLVTILQNRRPKARFTGRRSSQNLYQRVQGARIKDEGRALRAANRR